MPTQKTNKLKFKNQTPKSKQLVGGNKQNSADKKKQGGRNNKKKDKKAVTVALAPAQAFEAAPTFEEKFEALREQLEALNNTPGVDNMKVIAGADGINTIEAYGGTTLVASLTYAGDTLYSWNFLIDGATSHPTVIDASAAPAGVYIVGTSGNDTIIGSTQEGNADTILGGEGDDYIQVASADRLAAADIFGGEGVNTLAVGDITGTTAQTIVDADLTDKFDIDVLQVGNGDNNVVLGTQAALAGIDLLIGGTGADTFDATGMTSAVTLEGGGGADVLTGGTAGTAFVFDSIAQYTTAATISATAGNNVISFASASSAITLQDSHFSRLVSNVNLGAIEGSTNAANTVTFGTTAQAAGLDLFTVSAGTHAGNFTVESGFTNALDITAASGANAFAVQNTGVLNLVSGNGADTYNITSRTDASTLTINAGSGNDTVSFASVTNAVTLNDVSFANMTSVESLIGSITAANTFTLGTNASIAGLKYVEGGWLPDTLDASGMTSAVTLEGGDGTAWLTQHFGRVEGSSNGLSGSADILIGSTAGTTFELDSLGHYLSLDIISATGGKSIISFHKAQEKTVFYDGDFAKLVGNINLGTLVGSTHLHTGVYFDTNLQALGLDTFIINGVRDNWSYIQPGFTKALNMFSITTRKDTYEIRNTGALNIVTYSPSSTYAIFSRTDTTNLTIDAGGGNDNVQFYTSPVKLNDASFANFTGVEGLHVINSAANAFTLGTNASRAGLQTLTGGGSADSFTFDGFTTSLVMNGGDGNDTYYFTDQANFTTAISNASAVEIVGGAGTNTISFSNAVGALSLTDAQFASMTNIQSLVLGNGSNEITLGTRAAAAGIDTLIGGTGTDWLNAADFTGGITLQGWSSVSGAGENQSNDTLTGDTGTAGVDVFVLGDATSNAYASGYANEALIQNFDSNDVIVLAGITGQSGSISFSGNVGEITFGSDTTPVYTLIASMGAGTSAVLRNQVGENIARFASAEVDFRTLTNSNFQFMS